jgi:hypothetical protein
MGKRSAQAGSGRIFWRDGRSDVRGVRTVAGYAVAIADDGALGLFLIVQVPLHEPPPATPRVARERSLETLGNGDS